MYVVQELKQTSQNHLLVKLRDNVNKGIVGRISTIVIRMNANIVPTARWNGDFSANSPKWSADLKVRPKITFNTCANWLSRKKLVLRMKMTIHFG